MTALIAPNHPTIDSDTTAAEFLATVTLVNKATEDHNILLYINALAWLDPFSILDCIQPQSTEWTEEEDTEIEETFTIIRNTFTEYYPEVIQRINLGQNISQTLDYLKEQIEKDWLIEVTAYEDTNIFAWGGIPLFGKGCVPENDEWWDHLDNREEYETLFHALGIRKIKSQWYDSESWELYHSENNGSHLAAKILTQTIDLSSPDAPGNIMNMYADEYEPHITPITDNLRAIYFLLKYIYGCTGNSIMDMSHEDLSELTPLDWSRQDVELAYQMIRESDEIDMHVSRGLQIVKEKGPLYEELIDNIEIAVSIAATYSDETGKIAQDVLENIDYSKISYSFIQWTVALKRGDE